jgi:DNA replication licensing factor MCM6
MAIEGTVTRTTEVKPELSIGTFKCKVCSVYTEGIEQQFKFTKPIKCKSDKCNNTAEFDLVTKESVFQDWQKVRLQEHSSDIPAGSMPRSIDVILRGDMVEQAKPGDRTCFTGMLIVVPDIVQLSKPGEKAQSTIDTGKFGRNEAKPFDGIGGLQATGVKDLSYKMVFIAY